MEDKKKITVSEIKEHLANGVTRKTCSTGYLEENGSIQEKYGLSKAEVDRLFSYSKLKGLKTKFPKNDSFELVDDEEAILLEETPAETVAENVEPPMAEIVAEEPRTSDEPDGQADDNSNEPNVDSSFLEQFN